jgi:hypothetical protein
MGTSCWCIFISPLKAGDEGLRLINFHFGLSDANVSLMAYCKAKLERGGNKTSPLFQTILNRKHVRQMLAYAGYNSGTFLLALAVSWGYQTQ